jgi:glutaredoxin
VAYEKAAQAGRSPEPVSRVIYQVKPERSGGWANWLLWAAIGCGAWAAYQLGTPHAGNDTGGAVGSLRASLKGDASESELRRLAAGVRPGEVVMYSTTECVYCAQAKSWLNQYGFAFDECNMSVSARCESEFRSYHGNGTPYLVVRGQHMKDGFDSDEFVALLRR